MISSIQVALYEPFLTQRSKQLVNDCLDTNWISSKGKYVKMFEESFSNFVGTKHACTVSNGTLALDLALQILGVGRNDSVILPSLGYIAAASSVHRSGAKVIFADVNKDTLQICPSSVRRHIQDDTKAIIGIHNYGVPYDSIQIQNICDEYNLFHIEDCAEALGSRIDSAHVGNIGDIATYSFYGNKTITTGEGGMLCSNSKVLIERALHLKSHAVSPYKQYWHDDFGCNYRMTNIACALGYSQLEIINDILEAKFQLAEFYKQNTPAGCKLLQPLPESGHLASNWMNTFVTTSADLASDLRQHLDSHGVETRPLFYPVHLMPMFNMKYVKLANTELMNGCGLNLPSYPALLQDRQKLDHITFILNSAKRVSE